MAGPAGPWPGSGPETLKCNDKSARRGRGERSTVSVKKTPQHSGSPCVANLFVNCSSGPCSFVDSRTGIHHTRGRRWATTSVHETLNGKRDVVVNAQNLNQTRTSLPISSQTAEGPQQCGGDSSELVGQNPRRNDLRCARAR